MSRLKTVFFAAACSLLQGVAFGQSGNPNQITPLVKISAGYVTWTGQIDRAFLDLPFSSTGPVSGYVGGSSAVAGTGVMVDTSEATTDFFPATYLYERNGTFTYTLANSPLVNSTAPPALTAGTLYTLKLHFAEITPGVTAAGQRQFNVSVNGTQYLSNFDIVAEAGAVNRAIVKSYTVTPNGNGQIVIAFSNGAAGIPKVSGIELFSVAPVTSGVTSASAGPVYQLAAGGVSAPYSSDAAYVSGGSAPYTPSPVPSISTTLVNNPAPKAVYATSRGGAVTYTLPKLVPGQVYTVRLHFAETFHTLAGQRQFNVLINGVKVLSNFDIFAAAGGRNIAVIETFPAAANSGGQIVVSFTAGTFDIPAISAVELINGYRVSAGGPGASYWEADQGYNQGGESYDNLVSGGVAASVVTTTAVDPAPAIVYLYQRYGPTQYYFNNLTPGVSYGVRLHFAELYSGPGARQMNAFINGTQVLANYEIYANSGGYNKANVQEFTAVASSAGQIAVSTGVGATVANGPCIAGIELVGGTTGAVVAGQYKISGYVLAGAGTAGGSAAVPGATLTLSSVAGGVTTPIAVTVSGADGSYYFIVNSGGSYSVAVTPPPLLPLSLGGPKAFNNVTSNQPNANFTATFQSGGSLAPTTPNKEYIFVNGAVVAVEHPH